jgi:uncharacterized protein with LGFP repeats
MHYVNGVRTFRVYGAICDKWVQLGADLAFGRPLSNEETTQHGRRSTFADGKGIFWSAATGAHEVHGLIYQTYIEYNSDASCVGLPISDEGLTSTLDAAIASSMEQSPGTRETRPRSFIVGVDFAFGRSIVLSLSRAQAWF